MRLEMLSLDYLSLFEMICPSIFSTYVGVGVFFFVVATPLSEICVLAYVGADFFL